MQSVYYYCSNGPMLLTMTINFIIWQIFRLEYGYCGRVTVRIDEISLWYGQFCHTGWTAY